MEVKHRTPPKLPPINRVSSSSTSSLDTNSSLMNLELQNSINTPNKLRKPLPSPARKFKTPPISPSSPMSSSTSYLPRSSTIKPIQKPPPLDLTYSFSVVPSPQPKILPKYYTKIKSPIYSMVRTPSSPSKINSPKIKTPRRFNFLNFQFHRKNLFMSHTWRYDELNRDTHQRVKLISNELRNMGYTTWFDEDDMVNGNIDISMAEGIDNCDCFIVCLTKNYINKINEASKNMLIRDNCYKEFNYANVSNKIMIPLILEPGISKLPGIIGLYLGNQYFIDFSFSDFNSKEFYDSIEKLNIALKKYKIIENSIKKHTEQISKFKDKLHSSIEMYKRIYPVLKNIKSKSNFIFNNNKKKSSENKTLKKKSFIPFKRYKKKVNL
mgnify:CR=1 FL=1